MYVIDNIEEPGEIGSAHECFLTLVESEWQIEWGFTRGRSCVSMAHTVISPYVPACLLQEPEDLSSTSQTWIPTSWWWWDRWCLSACHMLKGKKHSKMSNICSNTLYGLKACSKMCDLFPFTWNPKDFAWRTSEWEPSFLPTHQPFSSAHEVLIIRTCLHMLMPISLRLCGHVGRKKDGGVEWWLLCAAWEPS